ncbi:hypothetical protein D3C83_88350 [compost metagenome]
MTGAAGKVRDTPPAAFADAHTASWATASHFILARVDGDRMTVRAIGAVDRPDHDPPDVERYGPSGEVVRGPIEIRRR